jgi:hypothetical protein
MLLLIRGTRRTSPRSGPLKVAEPYRDLDFSRASRDVTPIGQFGTPATVGG